MFCLSLTKVIFNPFEAVYFWYMEREVVNSLLVRKYNQPVPRYTSYPTVPYWKDELEVQEWTDVFAQKFGEQNHVNGISLYIHLPFCESLCTYCGCNKKITTNHKVEEEYLLAIEKEWQLYRKLMKQTPVIRELHLGGGTPTFFHRPTCSASLNPYSKAASFTPNTNSVLKVIPTTPLEST